MVTPPVETSGDRTTPLTYKTGNTPLIFPAANRYGFDREAMVRL
jgi:hypothetical protein